MEFAIQVLQGVGVRDQDFLCKKKKEKTNFNTRKNTECV